MHLRSSIRLAKTTHNLNIKYADVFTRSLLNL